MSTTRSAAACRRFANQGEAEGSSHKLTKVMGDLLRLRRDPRHRGRSWRGVRKPVHPALAAHLAKGKA